MTQLLLWIPAWKRGRVGWGLLKRSIAEKHWNIRFRVKDRNKLTIPPPTVSGFTANCQHSLSDYNEDLTGSCSAPASCSIYMKCRSNSKLNKGTKCIFSYIQIICGVDFQMKIQTSKTNYYFITLKYILSTMCSSSLSAALWSPVGTEILNVSHKCKAHYLDSLLVHRICVQ